MDNFISLSSWVSLLPFQCHVCFSWPNKRYKLRNSAPYLQGICKKCLENSFVPPAINIKDEFKSTFVNVIAPIAYEDHWRTLISRYKFQSDPALRKLFASLILQDEAAENMIRNSARIVPIPLTPKRLYERGFNQSQLLAQQLIKQLSSKSNTESTQKLHPHHKNHPQSTKLDDTSLIRLRDTPAQKTLGKNARAANLHMAFGVMPGSFPSKDEPILLVDDVITTGATVFHAAQALMKSGVRNISVLAIAHTPKYPNKN